MHGDCCNSLPSEEHKHLEWRALYKIQQQLLAKLFKKTIINNQQEQTQVIQDLYKYICYNSKKFIFHRVSQALENYQQQKTATQPQDSTQQQHDKQQQNKLPVQRKLFHDTSTLEQQTDLDDACQNSLNSEWFESMILDARYNDETNQLPRNHTNLKRSLQLAIGKANVQTGKQDQAREND